MKSDKTALVTGASGGIGLEIAKLFAKENYNLVLVARGFEKLEEISKDFKSKYSIEPITIPIDLSLPASTSKIFEIVSEQNIQIDFLINNAGFGSTGYFYETDLELCIDLMQVNMNAVVSLTRLFLPKMIEKKFGKILNVASTAAFAPGPLMSIYYATKAFVLSFSEAIANELKGSGVTVTTLCPGPTRTGFQKRASVDETRLFTVQKIHDAGWVAKKGYDAMMKNKNIIVPGIQNKVLIESIRVSPRKLVTQIARWLQEKRKQ